jgi:hypothetical protein
MRPESQAGVSGRFRGHPLLLACLCCLLSACVGGAMREHLKGDAQTLPERWHYQISIDPELTQIDARVCFEGVVPDQLRAGRDAAAVHLRYARWLWPGAVRKLDVVDGRIVLPSGEHTGCVAYGVALEDTPGMEVVMRREGRDLIASPNVWLWRPQRRAQNASASLRLMLPRGVQALLPWPERDHVYHLNARAFRFDSYAAFGPLRIVRTSQRGVPIEAALLDGPLSIDEHSTDSWLQGAVDSVSIRGHFPAARLQVLVVPAGESDEPSPFGMVSRGGSGSVLLFVAKNAGQAALRKDWVLPHELSHLWFPFVDREYAWLSEGLATYLQELLRARAGIISEQEALSELAQGMRSARHEGTGRNMADESRAMHHTYAFRSVYWSGAAFFLQADVALQQRSNGQRSLEDVLLTLQSASDYDRTWQPDELLARLDELAGSPVFTTLARSCLAQPFPDIEPTFAALGVRQVAGRTALDDGAPLAGLRRAMFAVRSP